MKRTRPTQDITRAEAAKLIDDLLECIEQWSRTPPTDSLGMIEVLRTLVTARGLKVPRPCTGEAHCNPHVDHCGVCTPRWGVVHDPVKVR